MKPVKRKIKFAVLFGLCWLGILVGLVDGVLGFERVKEWCGGSWAAAETVLWVAVLLPTVVVYFLTRDTK